MKNWDLNFAPSYTPKQMLEQGVFEGKYINAIKGLPASWYKLPKVVGPKDEPDVTLNKYGIKSRQPLSVWKKNGWTTKNSPNGWFEWYCLYHEGRRLEEEDKWQIARWRSFVARHMGQLVMHCSLKDEDKCKKQRQGLLQWGWDSTTKYTLEQRLANLKKLGVSVDKKELEEWEDSKGKGKEKDEDKKDKGKLTKESHAIIVPPWVKW